MIDIDDKIKKDTVQAIYDIDGVVRIRKLNGNK